MAVHKKEKEAKTVLKGLVPDMDTSYYVGHTTPNYPALQFTITKSVQNICRHFW